MQTRSESFDNTMTSSRRRQLKPSADKTSSDGQPRRRAPPKSTKSLDRNEFRSQLDDTRVSCPVEKDDASDKRGTGSNTPALAKLNWFPPAAASSHLQPSFGDNSLGSTHFKRSKSMDEIPYLASKIDNDEPANNAFTSLTIIDTGPQPECSEHSGAKSEETKAANGGLPGSQHAHTQSRLNNRGTCVHKIDDSSDKGGTSSNAPASTKVKAASPLALSKFKKKERKSSAITMTWSRNVQEESFTGNASLHGPPRRRAPPKSTKSLDGNEFRNQLGRNRVFSFDTTDERGTASNTTAPAKLKISPSTVSSKFKQEQPDSLDNTVTWSRSLQQKPSTDKTSRDGPPKRNTPPKSTKSLDENEFRSRLSRNEEVSPDTIGDGSEKRGTTSITPASAKLKSSLSTAQPEPFDNAITWSRSVQLKPATKMTSRDRTSRRRAPPKSITRRKRIEVTGRSKSSVLS